MSNPYQSPFQQNQYHSQSVLAMVKAPATALIIVSVIAIVLGVMGVAFDVFLIASGLAERAGQLNNGPVSEYSKIIIRLIWGLILLTAAVFVLFGAIRMYSLKSYRLSQTAAVVALIPMLGPCCLLGIPFGIWALIVLLKPEVRNAFQ